MKLTFLQAYAEGKPCQFHGPECDGGGETTVLCHIRRGHHGMSSRPSDLVAFWGCFRCHALFDSRTRHARYTRNELDLWGFDAMVRTLTQLETDGVIQHD